MIETLNLLLLKLQDQVKQSVEDIRYKANDQQQMVILTYYCTIIESSDSCIHLYNSNKFACIPVIVRNMLEALVDLINVIQNPDYINNLLASHHKQVKDILKPDNQSHNKTLMSPEIQQKIDEALSELRRLKEIGFTPIKEKNKFILAKMPEVYILYRHLCQYSHNNINALEERHLDASNNKIICFKQYSDEQKRIFLYYIYSILRVAFREVQLCFNLQNTKHSEKVVDLAYYFDQVFEKSLQST